MLHNNLPKYAATPEKYGVEADENGRTPFQRQRDRILFSEYFKRLAHKTQILSSRDEHITDRRNRLTHSLEVMSIAEHIGRALNLNLELIQAIALGHDIGHTPYGHIGERTLDEIIKKHYENYRFKHNVNAINVIKNIETEYKKSGLALNNIIIEGILKHTKFEKDNKIINQYMVDLSPYYPEYKHSVTLEGQVVNIADEIATRSSDFEDLCNLDKNKYLNQFQNLQLYTKLPRINNERKSGSPHINSTRSGIIKQYIKNIIKTSKPKLKDNSWKQNYDDKKHIFKENLIGLSDDFINNHDQPFEHLLFEIISNDSAIKESDNRAKTKINVAFEYFYANPKKININFLINILLGRQDDIDKGLFNWADFRKHYSGPNYPELIYTSLFESAVNISTMQAQKVFPVIICYYISSLTDIMIDNIYEHSNSSL